MEGMEGMNNSSGVTVVVGSDAPSDYHVASRVENPTGSAAPSATPPPLGVSPPPGTVPPAMLPGTEKKKRGRPRKYGPDGSVTKALSPKPISSAAPPPVIDFSSSGKPKKVRPVGSISKHQPLRMETENLGDLVSCAVGASFTPHIITVNAGEDVTMKVISFSQQGPRAICILSANGVISSVTLGQPDSSGGTLTYEGRFEILSLSGSFMPSESGGIRNRSGGMSVSLASPDGRVVGGGVAGLLVAAGPVQIVIGSFLTGNQHEQKPKKQKMETIVHAVPTSAVPITTTEMEEPPNYAAPKQNQNQNLSSASFRGDSWSSYDPDFMNKSTDVNVSLHG